MFRLLARLAPAALLLLPGCDLLRADLSVKTVCATLPDYAMPGTPVSGSFSTEVTYDLGSDLSVLTDKDFTSTLTLESLELSVGPGSGLADLGGVAGLEATVIPPDGSSLAALPVAQYTPGAPASPTSISAGILSDANLVPYLSDGKAQLHVEATGTMPAEPWTATVKACFLLEVSVDYGKKL
jgi:hypothetical protein